MDSGIHESRFLLSDFHALRTNFSPHHASRINPLPLSMLNLSNLLGLGSGDGGLRSLTIPWPPLSEFSGYDSALSE